MMLRHRLAHRLLHCSGIQPWEVFRPTHSFAGLLDSLQPPVAFNLGDTSEPFLARHLTGESCRAAGLQVWVGFFDCVLYVLRIVIPARDNNEVFEATCHEQLAVFEESEVART